MKTLAITTLLLFFGIHAFSQSSVSRYTYKDYEPNKPGITAAGVVVDGENYAMVNMPAVWIVDKRQFKNPIKEWQYKRLVRNVKKAYPLAKIAGVKIKEYNKLIVSTKSEMEKNRLMKACEKQLVAQFEKDIRDLTMTQGRILLKLIDRETGRSSYRLLEQFRGGTSAVCWQALARLFGNNLKEEYDPEKDDKTVEQIVCLIDNGLL